MNPGGPGGPGTDDLPEWGNLFPAALLETYDLVSWDPRGVGRSTAVQCFATDGAKDRFLNLTEPDNSYPVGQAQVVSYVRKMQGYARACAERNGELLNHVSTTDTARDLDLLRQAVGEPKLNFIGLSYGTLLGAVYANLFPDKLRAVVLDGVVDATDWFGPLGLSLSLRLSTDLAMAKGLDRFFQVCAASPPGQCRFSAGSWPATRRK